MQLDFDQADVIPCAYNARTNEVISYSFDPNEWDEHVAKTPPDLVMCQVFDFGPQGIAVTDVLGSNCWWSIDAREKDTVAMVIQWSVVQGLAAQAAE